MKQPTLMFDTLAFAKKVESSGLASRQAESIAEAMRDVFDKNVGTAIFTKQGGERLQFGFKSDFTELRAGFKSDIAALRDELKTEIADLRVEVKTEIARLDSAMLKLKTELIRWTVSLLLTQTAIIVSVIKFIH